MNGYSYLYIYSILSYLTFLPINTTVLIYGIVQNEINFRYFSDLHGAALILVTVNEKFVR